MVCGEEVLTISSVFNISSNDRVLLLSIMNYINESQQLRQTKERKLVKRTHKKRKERRKGKRDLKQIVNDERKNEKYQNDGQNASK